MRESPTGRTGPLTNFPILIDQIIHGIEQMPSLQEDAGMLLGAFQRA